MKSTRNMYCTGCLRTQAFLDCETHYVCSDCGKRLEKAIQPVKPASLLRPQVA